jgi:hypothetical protein
MANVGVTVATSAYLLASADERDAMAVVDLLEHAARTRLALERSQGPELVARASDRVAAQKVEAQIIAAWIKWYGEAFDSVARLPPAGATSSLRSRIERARAGLR